MYASLCWGKKGEELYDIIMEKKNSAQLNRAIQDNVPAEDKAQLEAIQNSGHESQFRHVLYMPRKGTLR